MNELMEEITDHIWFQRYLYGRLFMTYHLSVAVVDIIHEINQQNIPPLLAPKTNTPEMRITLLFHLL